MAMEYQNLNDPQEYRSLTERLARGEHRLYDPTHTSEFYAEPSVRLPVTLSNVPRGVVERATGAQYAKIRTAFTLETLAQGPSVDVCCKDWPLTFTARLKTANEMSDRVIVRGFVRQHSTPDAVSITAHEIDINNVTYTQRGVKTEP